ncbi:transglutaminase family protein [Candidatus Magnetaquicoccus inordinatus]|uniref:transglutaminase family protein n=1 Tax=Candidatus Magnetaquicoccus inordinatus TaxID=2496818 RepID=UPI00102B8A95|nr:transglutaminase family protein [Candidatus Magnetaquicoccus inordinatus]
MKYRIRHSTRYIFAEAVSISHNLTWLQPRATPEQTPLYFDWQIDPTPTILQERRDIFDNRVHYFEILEPHRTLSVTSVNHVERHPKPLPKKADRPWEEVRSLLLQSRTPELLLAQQFLLASPLVRHNATLADYAALSFPPGRSFLAAIQDLMQRIHTDFTYLPQVTTISTPLEEIMEKRQGVCQDFAHIGIAALRSLGLAARYVSGYLETIPPPGQPRLTGVDASHAWFSTLLPDGGWIDLDPTNNLLPSSQHITIAWGRDYSDIPPLKGVVIGGGSHSSLQVEVDVARMHEEKTEANHSC